MVKLIYFVRKLLERKEIKFLIVGGINTIVGYSAYALFIYLGLAYFGAYTIATIIGVANSYLWNRFFTFKSNNKALSEIIRFALVYFASFCFGLVFLWLIVKQFGINPYTAGIINIVVTTIISWVGHNKFSFRPKEVQ